MFYISEENFIDKFIANLKLLNVILIPFDTPDFYNGIEKMKTYFEKNITNFGSESKELSMLFIKNPYEGVYSRFRDAISEQNGWYISFENPEYISGRIKITLDDAEQIANDTNLSVPNEYIMNITKAFCEGSNIKVG